MPLTADNMVLLQANSKRRGLFISFVSLTFFEMVFGNAYNAPKSQILRNHNFTHPLSYNHMGPVIQQRISMFTPLGITGMNGWLCELSEE
jgi:hypothetical protein